MTRAQLYLLVLTARAFLELMRDLDDEESIELMERAVAEVEAEATP